MIEETSEDISAELRELSRGAKYCELQPKVFGKPIGTYFAELADRIDAAGKRARKSGHVSEMRAACVKCRKLAEEIWESEGGEDVSSVIAELKERRDAARAMMPRNCDGGTAKDLTDRFWDFCKTVGCGDCDTCPFRSNEEHCEMKWVLAPYTGSRGDLSHED